MLFTAALSTVLSICSAWLTAQLALRRFMREKAWERKTGVYAQMFEALHDMKNWHDVHLEAQYRGRELDPTRDAELADTYRKAKTTLSRKLSSEAWLLPLECLKRIEQLEKVLSQRHDTFFEEVDSGSYEIQRAVEDLRRLTRADLGIEGNSAFERQTQALHSQAAKLLKAVPNLLRKAHPSDR